MKAVCWFIGFWAILIGITSAVITSKPVQEEQARRRAWCTGPGQHILEINKGPNLCLSKDGRILNR